MLSSREVGRAALLFDLYVRPQRVCFFSCFVYKEDIGFAILVLNWVWFYTLVFKLLFLHHRQDCTILTYSSFYFVYFADVYCVCKLNLNKILKK